MNQLEKSYHLLDKIVSNIFNEKHDQPIQLNDPCSLSNQTLPLTPKNYGQFVQRDHLSEFDKFSLAVDKAPFISNQNDLIKYSQSYESLVENNCLGQQEEVDVYLKKLTNELISLKIKLSDLKVQSNNISQKEQQSRPMCFSSTSVNNSEVTLETLKKRIDYLNDFIVGKNKNKSNDLMVNESVVPNELTIELLTEKVTSLEKKIKSEDYKKNQVTLFSNQHKIRSIDRKVKDIEEHIKDLDSIVKVKEKEPKPSNSDEETLASLEIKLKQAKNRFDDLVLKHQDMNSNASMFEKLKTEACENSFDLNDLSKKVCLAEQKLDSLQKKVQADRNTLQNIRTCIEKLIEKILSCVNENEKSYEFAYALQILLQNGGEMLLSTWKTQIASITNGTPNSIIPIVYGLVANSLVIIDRTMTEPRVLCSIFV